MASVGDFAYRTPLRHALLDHGAVEWRALADAAIADRIGSSVPRLAIIDLSPLPRLGFKGRGTIPAMQARGLIVEKTPNRAFRQPDGSLCMVLAPGEVFLLGALDGKAGRLATLEHEWRIEDEERTYPMPRRDSHAWFAMTGEQVPELLAKLCAVDMRLHKFADLSIAQTSLARLGAIVLRADLGGQPVFHILSDSSAAAYMLTCLIDAAEEFGGGLAGFEALARP
jgi:sarcosine oxidase subunit gamma